MLIDRASIGFGAQESNSSLNRRQITQIKDSAVIFDIISQPLTTQLLEMASNKGISKLNALAMKLEQTALVFLYRSKDSTSDRVKTIISKAN